jgi:sulfur carrier protein
MQLTIAGERKEYPEGTTLSQLIEAEKVENPMYVTVSVNDDFVRQEDFAATTLSDGDVVEFMYFMGGGAR